MNGRPHFPTKPASRAAIFISSSSVRRRKGVELLRGAGGSPPSGPQASRLHHERNRMAALVEPDAGADYQGLAHIFEFTNWDGAHRRANCGQAACATFLTHH